VSAASFTSSSARSAGVTGILVALVVIETGALHLLLMHVLPIAAFALSVSNLGLVLWLVADYRALGRETVRVDDAAVTLSLGLRVRARIPKASISRAVAPVWGQDLGAAAPPVLNATKPTTPNVLLIFREPQELSIAGLLRRRVDRVAFAVDDGPALLRALT